MAIIDFNGDGRPDLLVIEATEQTAVVRSCLNADGTFTGKEAPSVPVGISTAAEVNSDGKVDIIIRVSGPAGNHGEALGPATLVICYGNADLTFRPQPGDRSGRRTASASESWFRI